jgi:glycosyltransferase involved in cell wall biosynthesis
LAADLGVPFVLEYNGSDAWISRQWGGAALPHEDLVAEIEELNFRAATLIVVVSEALADELAGRGVDRTRILVNPNGVDPERFNPGVDGSEVRRRYGIAADDVVVGFIGTFGAWHGAEVLAEAFVKIVRRSPKLRLCLLMVGDGPRRQTTQAVIESAGVGRSVVFTGRVPQAEGPTHLAACDILVAPHIPNADGTPFFGSPTKLFEYMAMGRAVVASDLDQLAEIVVDESSGLLVAPGDIDALSTAIERLSVEPGQRRALGETARIQVTRMHTWKQHSDRIVDRLEELLVAS